MMSPVRLRARGVVLLVVGVLLATACGDDGGDPAAGSDVRPFSEVQASEFAFAADPLDPTRGVFRVETSRSWQRALARTCSSLTRPAP
jgi:hypothetical protein